MGLFSRIAQLGISSETQDAIKATQKEAAEFEKRNNRKWYRQELHDQGYSWDQIDQMTKD